MTAALFAIAAVTACFMWAFGFVFGGCGGCNFVDWVETFSTRDLW